MTAPMSQAIRTVLPVSRKVRKISQTRLTEKQTHELLTLMEAAKDLESIGDVVETNLVGCGQRRVEEGVQISASTQELIGEFHDVISRILDDALLAVTQRNERAAEAVVSMKKEIHRMAERAALHHVERLVVSEPNRLDAYAIETDIISSYKRIYYYAQRMVRLSAAAGLVRSQD